MTWMMPHEGTRHVRTWMAWPSGGYTLGQTVADATEARTTWAAVAKAVSEFEPVTMVVDPADIEIAKEYIGDAVDYLEAPLDDAWMRDIGPTFVTDGTQLGAVDWIFNGWGGQEWARWAKDEHIAEIVASSAGVHRITSQIVNEGGGIHVDGEGTVLATRTVQLDPGRNPNLTEADIENEFARTIGATHTIWLPRGLTRDSELFGTRGHVDIVATFTKPGSVLVHSQRNASHPDYEVSLEIIDVLNNARDAKGRSLEIVEMPAPDTLTDSEGWVDYSYINHLLVNEGVVACSFDDARDDEAVSILREVYPGRKVVIVDARPLYARGGGIHCITQQQPAIA